MRVAPDAERDTQDEHVDRGPVPSVPSRPDSATDGISDRVRAARRARRRARYRQAVGGRRQAVAPWLETLGRAWMGIALLVLVGGIVWIEVSVSREAARQATEAAARAAAEAAYRAEHTVLAPEITPDPPAGPEIGFGLIEANGPIMGCIFQPRLGELRDKIGAGPVGDCVEAPRTEAGGVTRQRTTRGELVWNEADGRASFTNGDQTWITGPDGLVRRRAEERFAWESDADAGPRPEKTAHVLPSALPGSILPGRRIVSYYGNPLATGMGVLGELPPEQLFPRLNAQAEAYRSADGSRAVQPALELVAVVAQGAPGPDGLYRLRMETDLIERVAGWAEDHGFILILDVQIGRGQVDDEVRWLLPFLRRPSIHLALDPEFAMPAGHVPGERIGTMDAAAINGALHTLAELVEAEHLPPKLLVVHRFTEEMVTSPRQIATDPRVQVVMVMDGFGSPPTKTKQYDELIAQPRVQYTGVKLFYRHDEPLMTPQQVLDLDPAPDLVIYQ